MEESNEEESLERSYKLEVAIRDLIEFYAEKYNVDLHQVLGGIAGIFEDLATEYAVKFKREGLTKVRMGLDMIYESVESRYNEFNEVSSYFEDEKSGGADGYH